MPLIDPRELKKVDLFSELRLEERRAVAELFGEVTFEAGDTVCRQGRPADKAYYVKSGRLKIQHVNPDGIEEEVGTLEPESFFGQTSLLLGEPHDATVTAIEESTVLTIQKDDFDRLLDERPQMMNRLQLRSDVARKRDAPSYGWEDPDESVVLSMHKHAIFLLNNLLLPAFLVLLDVAAFGYWYAISASIVPLIIGVLLLLPPLGFAGYLILDHYNDDYIVTNKRVVHEERIPFLRESRVEAPLRTIQDIQESQEGLLAQMYDFGDLIIETAGERGHIVFREIPDPEETRNIIFEQIQRARATSRAQELRNIRSAMHEHFGIKPEQEEEEGEEVTEGEDQPEKKARYGLRRLLRSSLEAASYFFPSLRQEQGDTITWRKHWIALLKPIALPTLLGVLSTVFAVLVLSFFNWLPVLILYGLAMVFIIPWWLWNFDDWRNDVYQVTQTRIIDVERLPFYLREQRREASLGKIQNINLEVPGFFGKVLNYGSVRIETAGSGAFTFPYVHKPYQVQAEIFSRVEKFQERQEKAETARRRDQLLDWFSVYDQIQASKTENEVPSSSEE